MPTRRAWIMLGGATAVAASCAAAWMWWLPGIVRHKATSALATRTGLPVRIADASLRWNGVRVSGVTMGEAGGAFEVRLAGVRAEGAPWNLAFGGTRGVERVVVEGGEVRLDLGHESLDSDLAQLGGALRAGPSPSGGAGPKTGSTTAPSAGAPARSLEVHDLTLEVRDERGELARLDEAEIVVANGRVRARAGRVRAGGASADRIELEQARLAAARAPGEGWQLAEVSVGAARAVWDDGAASGQRLPARIAAAVHQARSALGSGEAPVKEGSSTSPWWERLAPDLKAVVDGLDVRSATPDGERSILTELHASVRGDGADGLQSRGQGRTGAGGSIRWDLRFVPGEARVEGTLEFRSVSLALVAPLLPAVPWHEPEAGRLDAELEVRAESAARFAFSGEVSVVGASLYSERIAPQPVRDIAVRLDGDGFWIPLERRIEIESGRLYVNEARADLSGALEWTADHYLIDLDATVPPLACNRAVGALPHDLLGDAGGFRWEGSIGGRLVLRVDSRKLDETELDIDVADGCRFLTVPAAADLRRFRGAFTHRVREPDGTYFEMATGPGTPDWVWIQEVSPFLLQAILAHEDAAFFRHDGFAPWAIREALVRNLEAGRYVLGASTISMQLTKNLLLHREKTLARKVQEVLLTWWIESNLEKREILELYVNVIEYGPDVYGIRHAAHYYFGREPAELSPAEAAFFACILPAPKRYHAQYERGELSRGTAARMRRLLRHMRAKGRIDPDALEYGLEEIDNFSFRPQGAGAPPPRVVRGRASPLPFQGLDPMWPDDPSAAPGAFDPWNEAFEDVPRVDPDAPFADGG